MIVHDSFCCLATRMIVGDEPTCEVHFYMPNALTRIHVLRRKSKRQLGKNDHTFFIYYRIKAFVKHERCKKNIVYLVNCVTFISLNVFAEIG